MSLSLCVRVHRDEHSRKALPLSTHFSSPGLCGQFISDSGRYVVMLDDFALDSVPIAVKPFNLDVIPTQQFPDGVMSKDGQRGSGCTNLAWMLLKLYVFTYCGNVIHPLIMFKLQHQQLVVGRQNSTHGPMTAFSVCFCFLVSRSARCGVCCMLFLYVHPGSIIFLLSNL
jgi:hypothetical protein